MNQLGKIFTGNTPSTIDRQNWDFQNSKYIWITPTDIHGLLTSSSERHLSQKGWTIARVVPKNSVLITSIASIGKNTINTVPAAFNQQINAIVPENHDAYFVLSAMTKETKKFYSIAGKTATPIINKSTFEKFNITIPDIEEQQKIGSFFQQLDNLITLHQREVLKNKGENEIC